MLAIDVNDKNRARYGTIETFTTEEINPALVLAPDGNNGVHFIEVSTIIPVKENEILVTQANVATTLGGTIDSTKEYYIDGVIDCTGVTFEAPAGQTTITGGGANVSQLICDDNNYTMFTSIVGGCGAFIQSGIGISVTGTNSQVYNLTNSGFNTFSASRVIWSDCTSLGSLNKFLQGLEETTTRLRGTPQLELIGNWIAGYFISVSNTISLVDGVYTLFKAGTGLVINTRFRTNQGVTLPANASFCDFSDANFANPSTFQLSEVILSRNGVFDSLDPNITPNIEHSDLSSYWKNCVGISNTHVGGQMVVSTEVETVIAAASVYYPLLGTQTAIDLEHFDMPVNGQLRHLGNTPIEYKAIIKQAVDGGANDELSLRLMKYDAVLTTSSAVCTQLKVVNNFQGGRDVAFFDIYCSITLNQNDYVFLEIANLTNTDNVTAELDSFLDIEER